MIKDYSKREYNNQHTRSKRIRDKIDINLRKRVIYYYYIERDLFSLLYTLEFCYKECMNAKETSNLNLIISFKLL